MAAPAHQASIDTLIDLVTYDDRPTLLLDTHAHRIRFCNIAFDSLLQGTAASTAFQSWVDSLCAVAAHATHEPVDLGTFAHQRWLGKRLRTNIMTVFCRWTPAPALSVDDAVMLEHDQQEPDEHNNASNKTKLTDMYMGWLEPRDDPWLSFVRNYPFHDTLLGPISAWHPQLRRAVQRMMVCPESRILYWGDQHLMLYNEAAVPILGQKHPCLGMSLVDTWGQAMADQIDATIRAVVLSGKALQMKDIMFIMHRHDFPEQTWHHFYQLPITDPEGRYLGCVCEFAENTTAVVQENRAAILDASIGIAANATDLKQIWSLALNPLTQTSIDIAAGCIFSVPSLVDGSQSSQSTRTSQDYVLEASFGLTNPQSSSSLLKILDKASDYEKLLVLRRDDDTLPSNLQWSTADHTAINIVCILPITDLNNRRLAVAVLGMNPGRPFDEGSKSFVSRIGDWTRKSAIFVTLPEEQKKTAAITSALSDKLQIALLEAEMQQDSYARMARQAPIGMYMLRPDGYPVFVNDAYLELHGVSRAQFYKSAEEGFGWNPTLHEDDVALANEMWTSTISGTKPIQNVVRIMTKECPDGIRFVESMSFAERDEAGIITSVQGWLLDVSPRKLNERLIQEKLQDALETKRATETFLDMLSHEMRNPLSSILQLADGIMSLLDTPPTPDTVEPLKDSAQTVTLCARHMKTIIDEVLTFSKLDSNLLVLSLERAQAPTIIETALKMFEKEIEHAKIVANMEIDQSYVDLAVDFVLVDPSRLLQVIINFLSNSIKFTKFEQERRITIKLAASATKPTEKDFGIAFLDPRKDPTRDTSMPSTPTVDMPEFKFELGEEVYIYVGVEDTGRGLTKDECKVLFQRFAQASPKTYKTYGGSGLGLFISRGLSELHGGQIGVKSAAGVGSTFAFFIKTRRAEPPRPASGTESVKSVEALTGVLDLPHAEGQKHVKVLTKSSTTEESHLSVKDLHVLVCEDNKINQKVIAQQLRRLGVHTVHVADDGLAALNFLATTTFCSSSATAIPLSIILMDVEMPVMDGLGAIRRIRQSEVKGDIAKHVPVIAITANARQEQVAVALEAGMDEVVTKPFLVRELVPRMVALVQRYVGGG